MEEEFPIQINDLRKTFGEQTVLDGISLQVRNNETLAVLGRSGTGKSVLLKLIVGLQKADSGSINVHGSEMTRAPIDELNQVRRKIGYLFQQAALYDSLTVAQNVAFPVQRNSPIPENECRDRVRQLLADVGMEKELDKYPSEISGGMQKRVGLARALALDPDLLLFDEPTAGLDPITAAEIGKLIIELKEKRHITAIVVTHDIRRAASFADHAVLLNDGHIHMEGSFDELKKSDDAFVKQFMDDEAVKR
jgi:phospholipid/cholesterol/gamma-HCH transport system ATP-binding protein